MSKILWQYHLENKPKYGNLLFPLRLNLSSLSWVLQFDIFSLSTPLLSVISYHNLWSAYGSIFSRRLSMKLVILTVFAAIAAVVSTVINIPKSERSSAYSIWHPSSIQLIAPLKPGPNANQLEKRSVYEQIWPVNEDKMTDLIYKNRPLLNAPKVVFAMENASEKTFQINQDI